MCYGLFAQPKMLNLIDFVLDGFTDEVYTADRPGVQLASFPSRNPFRSYKSAPHKFHIVDLKSAVCLDLGVQISLDLTPNKTRMITLLAEAHAFFWSAPLSVRTHILATSFYITRLNTEPLWYGLAHTPGDITVLEDMWSESGNWPARRVRFRTALSSYEVVDKMEMYNGASILVRTIQPFREPRQKGNTKEEEQQE